MKMLLPIKKILMLASLILILGITACDGQGTETTNPTQPTSSSPSGDSTSSSDEGSDCTDADDDGLDDNSGEECNTTDAAINAIVNYLKTQR